MKLLAAISAAGVGERSDRLARAGEEGAARL
jgi:hypothetical protein